METLGCMDTTTIQQWHVVYLCAALLFSAATLVAGSRLLAGDPPAVSTRCTVSLTAGALWPLIVAGLMQLWVIDQLVRRMRRVPEAAPAAESERPPVGAGGPRRTH